MDCHELVCVVVGPYFCFECRIEPAPAVDMVPRWEVVCFPGKMDEFRGDVTVDCSLEQKDAEKHVCRFRHDGDFVPSQCAVIKFLSF